MKQGRPNREATQPLPSWFAIAGYIAGAVTLLFFMGLVLASVFNHNVPPNGRFAVLVVLAFGLAFSFAFIGGAAAAHGTIPIPFTKKEPLTFSVTGGIAVFVIALVLGHHLYIPPNQTFTATIRPHGKGVPVITSGSIRLEYGDNSPAELLNSRGEAEFKLIPISYMGQQANVSASVDGYSSDYQPVSLTDVGIDITLTKATIRLDGSIVPAQTNKTVKILAEGEEGDAVPDQFGRFTMILHRQAGERVRLSVWVNGKQQYDEYQTLPGPVILSIGKQPAKPH